MKQKALKPKISVILASLLAALILRVVFEDILNGLFPAHLYAVTKSAEIAFYLIIVASCISIIHSEKIPFDTFFRRPLLYSDLCSGIFWSFTLLSFSLGSSSLFIYVFAHVNLDKAYEFGGFHPFHVNTLGSNFAGIALFALPQFLLGPFAEEFIFRGLLMRGLMEKYGYTLAIIGNSIIFTLLHFSQADYIGTFVFAVVLSILFAKTRSLFVPVIIHSFFNLLAYLQQGFFDFHWTRSKGQILDIADWKPEIILLLCSTLFICIFLSKNWPNRGSRYANGVMETGECKDQSV